MLMLMVYSWEYGRKNTLSSQRTIQPRDFLPDITQGATSMLMLMVHSWEYGRKNTSDPPLVGLFLPVLLLFCPTMRIFRMDLSWMLPPLRRTLRDTLSNLGVVVGVANKNEIKLAC